jgi:DNA-binding transcriptional ArsR family regulator
MTQTNETLELIAELEDGGFRRLVARLAILRAYAQHREANHLSDARAQEEIADAFSARETDLDEWVYAVYDSVTGRTLRRWENELLENGLVGLTDRHGRRSRRSYDSYFGAGSELRKIAFHYLADHPECTGPELHDELAAQVDGEDLPDLRTVQRFLSKMRG